MRLAGEPANVSVVTIGRDQWLSDIFGCGVFKVDAMSGALDPQTESHRLRDALRAHASNQSAAVYYTKIDTGEVTCVRAVAAAGFYVVDVNVTLAADPRQRPTEVEAGGMEICDVRPALAPGVLDIAGSSFRYSRFHLDPLVPRRIADQVKREWVQSYVAGRRGDRLFVALNHGVPAGFLAALVGESDGRRAATIDLVGVSQAHQRRGVGRMLVNAFMTAYRDQCDVFQVGTQIANIPSLRLYDQLGFSITRSSYVMHMHKSPAA